MFYKNDLFIIELTQLLEKYGISIVSNENEDINIYAEDFNSTLKLKSIFNDKINNATPGNLLIKIKGVASDLKLTEELLSKKEQDVVVLNKNKKRKITFRR